MFYSFLTGLFKLFRKIDDTYYELHPHETLRRYILGRKSSYVKSHFKPYNPEPRHLKKVSDTAKSLLLQLNSLKLDKAELKQREIKAMAQTKHFLAHSFGNPYDYDYYAGKIIFPQQLVWKTTERQSVLCPAQGSGI